MNNKFRFILFLLVCCWVQCACVSGVSSSQSRRDLPLSSPEAPSSPRQSASTSGRRVLRGSDPPATSDATGPTGGAFSGPVHDSFDPIRFSDDADEVIVASLLSSSLQKQRWEAINGTKIPIQEYQGIFKVERVYKGAASPSGVLRIEYAGTPSQWDLGYIMPHPGELALYFLKKGPDNRLHFFSPYIPSFPVLKTRPSIDTDAPVKRAIRAELFQNILQAPLPLAEASFKVLWTSAEGVELARRIAQDTNRPWRLRDEAAAYLMMSRDPGAVEFGIELIEDARKKIGPGFRQSLRFTIGSLDYQRGLSKSQLRRLLALKDQGIDYSLSTLFMESHDPQYASAAIELLTSDLNRDTLPHIYTYLSELGPVPPPNGTDFFTARSKYIAQYLDWWNRTGKQKYGGTD